MWNLKKKKEKTQTQNTRQTKEKKTHRHREQIRGYQREKVVSVIGEMGEGSKMYGDTNDG